MPKKKLPKLSHPLWIERKYQKSLRGYITRIKDIIQANIVVNLPSIMAETEALRPRIDSHVNQKSFDIYINQDENIGQKVDDLFKATRAQVSEDITDIEIDRLTQDTARDINEWNRAKVTEVIRQGLGIDILLGEPFLAEEMRIFAINNAQLIKSNNAAFINQVEQITYDGMRRGLRHEVIAKQILGVGKDELGKVSRFRQAKTRANLIGRDQVNKFNGNLNRLRQENAGIKRYIWRTVNDSRVRDKHALWESDIVEWKEGKPGHIHPGDEINCRCYAEPVLDDLL